MAKFSYPNECYANMDSAIVVTPGNCTQTGCLQSNGAVTPMTLIDNCPNLYQPLCAVNPNVLCGQSTFDNFCQLYRAQAKGETWSFLSIGECATKDCTPPCWVINFLTDKVSPVCATMNVDPTECASGMTMLTFRDNCLLKNMTNVKSTTPGICANEGCVVK